MPPATKPLSQPGALIGLLDLLDFGGLLDFCFPPCHFLGGLEVHGLTSLASSHRSVVLDLALPLLAFLRSCPSALHLPCSLNGTPWVMTQRSIVFFSLAFYPSHGVAAMSLGPAGAEVKEKALRLAEVTLLADRVRLGLGGSNCLMFLNSGSLRAIIWHWSSCWIGASVMLIVCQTP